MTDLFEKSFIRGLELKNRFIRSATWEGMAAEDGAVTPRLTAAMQELAEGGVGLIITGSAFVEPRGTAGRWNLGADRESLVPGFVRMTEQVHAAGGRIVLQISHAGVFARQKWTGRPALAVSADAECPGEKLRQEIDGEEIKALTEGFAAAAARARAGGFDGVQIHAGHGYLLNQFLSPLFNQRRDAYGGSIENRGRILVQILRAVREAVGPRYPVLVKLNGSDHEENGLTLEESIAVGRMLKENGLDAVELSGGLLSSSRTSPCRTGIHGPDEEAYFLSDAAAFRESVSIPLILVGGIRSLSTAESIRERKTADYIAMSRPFIREPGLIRRWRDGDTRSSFCNSDNLCFGPGIRGEGIYCVSRYGKGKEG